MDYSQAASELIDRMFHFFHTPEQRKLSDFPKGENFILNYLTDREGPVLPSELSGAMQASTARVAAALNSLEAKGEITRPVSYTHLSARWPCRVSLPARERVRLP